MLISLLLSLFACSTKTPPVAVVTPAEEKPIEETASTAELDPTKTSGILAPHVLQTNLTHDYESIEKPLTLRARKLIINDSGVVGQHNHDTRLGYAYIASGEITEYREGSEPLIHKTGDFVSEEANIAHYWHNGSGAPARAIVFDILTPENALAPTISRELKLQGPTANVGIESVEVLNTLDLSQTYAGLEGKVLRARMFTLSPDAIIGQHSHRERSGYVYVVSGEIVEVRNDLDKPLTRRAGDIILEENGVEHYWENKSGAQVQLLSVDIFTPEPKE